MSVVLKVVAYSMTCVLLAFIVGCGGIGFAYEKNLSGKYCLVACDVLEQMSIDEIPSDGGNIYNGVISATVFAVGWDEHFIIVKQHPRSDKHPAGDRAVTYFYILRVSDGKLSEQLDKRAFNVERDKLGVSKNLSFSLVFDELK